MQAQYWIGIKLHAASSHQPPNQILALNGSLSVRSLNAINTLSRELCARIVKYLPIDQNLAGVALAAHSNFTHVILGDIHTARAHLKLEEMEKQMQPNYNACMPNPADTENWMRLPFIYKCATYEIMFKSEIQPQMLMFLMALHRRNLDYNEDDDDDDDCDNDRNSKSNDMFIHELMLHWRLKPLLSAQSYFRMIQLLIENDRLIPHSHNAYCNFQGHVEIVSKILKDSRVDPTARNNQALLFAGTIGSLEIVDLLLKDLRIDPTISSEARNIWGCRNAFSRACKNGHEAIMERFLQDPRIDPSADRSIRFAAEKGHFGIVKRLLADPRVDPSDSEFNMFHHADIVELLLHLSNKCVDPASAINMYSRIWYPSEGMLDLAKQLFRDIHLQIDPSRDNNIAIIDTASLGDLRAVETLLCDRRVDRTANRNLPIRYASRWIHADVIARLLKDERVDPTDMNNEGIRVACAQIFKGPRANKPEEPAVVQVLLSDPRVDPSVNQNECLRSAMMYNHVEIFQLLINDQRLDLTYNNNNVLVTAVIDYVTSLDILEILLACERVKPEAQDNLCIRTICKSKIQVPFKLKTLLADPRINPGACDNEAFINAVKHNGAQIIKILLQDSRINPAARNSEALISAVWNSDQEVINMLLSDQRINVSLRGSEALNVAIGSQLAHSIHVIKRLLADSRVDLTAQNNLAFRSAVTLQVHYLARQDIVELFIKYGRIERNTVLKIVQDHGDGQINELVTKLL
ncbi:hypothetical protein HK100_007671 [Physocladia obscura]|uniref:Ankyrin n=1 Tax=Physocladia obscura TaxID=109957 RepID=A0AAD5SQ53_9FUNG|nr:hypothetical protein HK100_007671 [Physocladia obscura]